MIWYCWLKGQKTLSMPTWVLLYQLRYTIHTCCLPIPLSQPSWEPTILDHGDTLGSTTLTQDFQPEQQQISVRPVALFRDCIARTCDTPHEHTRSVFLLNFEDLYNLPVHLLEVTE